MNGILPITPQQSQTNAHKTKLERTTTDGPHSPLDTKLPSASAWSPAAQLNGAQPNGPTTTTTTEFAPTFVATNNLRPIANDDGESTTSSPAASTPLVDLNDHATPQTTRYNSPTSANDPVDLETIEHDQRQRESLGQLALVGGGPRRTLAGGQIVRRFQKFDSTALSSAPAPDVKIGQRVAYKEYYGNEFGTIRWIGRVPQISPDWTVGVEFDNAIGEGDGSLNGRRYFIAKDCFAKFLALSSVTLVDQHVGRPEPGTMISVMSAAVRPGQMISIQRVSTVHVQHCFLNAPHRRPGAEFLAVNTRLHCQCPNCGPCAHVVKPPRTQRLMTPKNATHMCQFSTYTCCGMESSDEALCTYTGNKISSLPPPPLSYAIGGSLPPLGNSWMDGSGYLSQLQAEQRKLMPEEYRLGAAPEDAFSHAALVRRGSSSGKRRGGGHQHHESSDAPPTCDSLGLDAMSRSPTAELRNKHKFYHREHQHQHHHHRHRHKSPLINKTPGEEQPENQTDEQRPVYVNLDGAGQMQPDADAVIDMQNEATTVDDIGRAPLSGNDHSSWGDELRNQESGAAAAAATDHDDPNDPDDHNRRLYRALSAVQHRDSIENRYLFPTDDIIDSLLEADLDTLSQARYGCGGGGGGGGGGGNAAARGQRGHSSAGSSASGRGRRTCKGRGARNRRQRRNQRDCKRSRRSSSAADSESGRPKAILQRLRSLVVSCMTATRVDENGNRNGSPPSESNQHRTASGVGATYTTLERRDSRAQQAPPFSSAVLADWELGRPLGASWQDEIAECYCRQQQLPDVAYSSGALAEQTTITNEIITLNGGIFARDLVPQQEQPTLVAEQTANKAQPTLLGRDHEHLASDHLYSNDDFNDYPFECDKLASQHSKTEHRREKLICSHAAAAAAAAAARRRARGATGALRSAPSSRAYRHKRAHKHRLASSSSDCGFSSASQNSINVGHHTNATRARPCNSPGGDLDKRVMGDLYRRLASRLADHLSAAGDNQQARGSGEELLKLGGALLDLHSETCRLHQGGTPSSSPPPPPLSCPKEFKWGGGQPTPGPTQDCALLLLADLLRRTSPGNNHHEVPKDWCTCSSATFRAKQASSDSCDSGHLSSLVCNLSELHELHERTQTSQEQLEEDSASTVQMEEFEEREQQSGRYSRLGGQSSSEAGANIARAEVHLRDEAAKTATVAAAAKSLPRAFELKLTLSINPEMTGADQGGS